MLLVHAHIEFLQVTHPSTDMRHFIDGDRFAQCSATGQNSHQSEKNNGKDLGKAHHSRCYESAQPMVSVNSTEAAWARRRHTSTWRFRNSLTKHDTQRTGPKGGPIVLLDTPHSPLPSWLSRSLLPGGFHEMRCYRLPSALRLDRHRGVVSRKG